MRSTALAAAVAVCMGLMAGPASAERFADANMVLNAPSGWTVRQQNMSNGTAVLAFTPSSDCWFFGIPNAGTASASVQAVRNTVTPLTAQVWSTAAAASPDFFEGTPSVVSSSVDTSGFWPVQRATFQGARGTVQGVIMLRPGFELRGFCMGPNANYDAILNGLGHANDAQWQASAPPAAAAPATTPTPAPAQ